MVDNSAAKRVAHVHWLCAGPITPCVVPVRAHVLGQFTETATQVLYSRTHHITRPTHYAGHVRSLRTLFNCLV